MTLRWVAAGSCYEEENPRVGWANNNIIFERKRGRGLTTESDEINAWRIFEYADCDLWIYPWTGGKLHESRGTDSTSKSALYTCFSFGLSDEKYILFFLFLIFRIPCPSFFLSFFFLPPSIDRV